MATSLYGRGLAKRRKHLIGDGEADMKAAVAIQPGLPTFFEGLGLRP